MKKIIFILIFCIYQNNASEILGNRVDWLCQGNMHFKITLNTEDECAIEANKGKLEPVMLAGCRAKDDGRDYGSAVLAVRGSHIQFVTKDKDGYAYRLIIRNAQNELVKIHSTASFDIKEYKIEGGILCKSPMIIRRYQNEESTICIDSLRSIHPNQGDVAVQNQTFDEIYIRTKRMESYRDLFADDKFADFKFVNGSYKLGSSSFAGNEQVIVKNDTSDLLATLNICPEATATEAYCKLIPTISANVRCAALKKGGISSQCFESIRDVKYFEDEDSLSTLTVRLFVFANDDALNEYVDVFDKRGHGSMY